ncbi:MAG: hypothetical protein LBH53_00310, partial [Puniceicoccales bacterium]|nr:hypothetical protein [Puniceicoccales bacterium]
MNFCGDLRSSVFAKNSASNGGALFVSNNFVNSGGEGICDLGGSYFLGNQAASSGYGGALFIRANAKLAAKTGDVIFQGNFAGDRQEGIFFANDQGGNTIWIGAESGHTFYYYDPIRGNINNASLILEINPEQEHSGTVLLDKYPSEIWFGEGDADAYAKVSYGTLVLQNGASFGAGEENFTENEEQNWGTFTLAESATLRIGYEQLSRSFSIESGMVRTEPSWPSYSNSNVSKINAGDIFLNGTLQFLLPTNIQSGDVLLHVPYGNVYLRSGANQIAVGAVGKLQSLEVGESVVLLQCDKEIIEKSSSYSSSTGGGLENLCVPGYKFSISVNTTQLLATLIGEPEGNIPSPEKSDNPPSWSLFPLPFAVTADKDVGSDGSSGSGSSGS